MRLVVMHVQVIVLFNVAGENGAKDENLRIRDA